MMENKVVIGTVYCEVKISSEKKNKTVKAPVRDWSKSIGVGGGGPEQRGGGS